MPYTVTTLSQFGDEMLDRIKKNNVSFIKNFDDSEIEPTKTEAKRSRRPSGLRKTTLETNSLVHRT